MPQSPSEISGAYERLRTHLKQLFADESATVAVAEGSPVPTLLLRTKNQMAAFALSNGNPQQCYDSAYPFFKKLYADRHLDWDALNLSFVLCLAHRKPELERLCMALESDVYFCRKFVVFLDQPIARELARLPFVPLERSDSTFKRPPSAQTLLKSRNVPARLAQAIAAQPPRSAERIAQDCLNGEFGELELRAAQVVAEPRSVQAPLEIFRLDAVEIKNFRAYRKAQTLDLAADLVVLYGPNGFGKTSFFDAVDFAATGGIGRLHIDDRLRFSKAAKHLDSGSEPSTVSLKFRVADSTRMIERTVGEEEGNRAILDGESVTRKAALVALTGFDASSGADRVENMERLFRATHLFSQEFPNLTEDIREKSELSSDVVSRLLAFEDYVRAGRKVEGVCDVLSSQIRDRSGRAAEITAALTRDRAELAELQQRAGTADNPEAVLTLARDVRAQLQTVGIEVSESPDTTTDMARGWRALIESRIAETRSIGERLTTLASNASHIAALRGNISAGREELASKRTAHSDAGRGLLEQKAVLDQSVSEVAGLKERQTALSARGRTLNWLSEIKPQHDQILQTHSTLQANVSALTESLTAQKALCERLNADLLAADTKIKETEQAVVENKQLLELLDALPAQHALWERHVRRHRDLAESAASARAQVNDWQTQLTAATKELNEYRLAEQRAAADFAQHQQTQSGLQNLLSEIESYITGGACPVCGDDHGSRETLIARLHAQQGVSTAVGEIATRLQQARASSTSAVARTEELQTQITQTQGVVVSAENQMTQLATEIANLEEQARRIGSEVTDPQFTPNVAARRDALTRRSEELAGALPMLRQTADGLRTALGSGRTVLTERERELATATQAHSQAVTAIQKNLTEAQRLQVSLDLEPARIAEDQRATNEQLRDIIAKIAASEATVATQRAAITAADQQMGLLRQAIENLEGSFTSSQRAVENYEADLRALALPADADVERLSTASQANLLRLSAWENMKQSVLNLEVALDAAATSALVAQLNVRIRAAEEELGRLGTTREQAWLTHFSALRDLLRDVQDQAVSAYTQQFGPQTSIIQKRLRAVFGFDDIVLTAARSSIEVRVSRNGELLVPPDFFSQSQQQILMLSLFLTACTTQNWSAFAPIFLDDPITHFDDLNSYAFLDLIDGLLDSGFHGRQVILSTCDERFFQLARQKFASVSDRAKFYKFVALTSDGPVIERV